MNVLLSFNDILLDWKTIDIAMITQVGQKSLKNPYLAGYNRSTDHAATGRPLYYRPPTVAGLPRFGDDLDGNDGKKGSGFDFSFKTRQSKLKGAGGLALIIGGIFTFITGVSDTSSPSPGTDSNIPNYSRPYSDPRVGNSGNSGDSSVHRPQNRPLAPDGEAGLQDSEVEEEIATLEELEKKLPFAPTEQITADVALNLAKDGYVTHSIPVQNGYRLTLTYKGHNVTVYAPTLNESQFEEVLTQMKANGHNPVMLPLNGGPDSNGSSPHPMLPILGFFMVVGGGTLMFFAVKKPKGAINGVESTDPELPAGFTYSTVSLNDIGGLNPQTMEDIRYIASFQKLRNNKVGAKTPKGVLLHGPPGTGKTEIANAIATSADLKIYTISGASFIEQFVGVGAKRVREVFAHIKANSPCVLFIDEIDALIGRRDKASHDREGTQTVAEVLNQLNKLPDNVMVIGATNYLKNLDSAAVRTGRFDRKIKIPLPQSPSARLEIMNIHINKYPRKVLAPDVNLLELAEKTAGYSGADLAGLINWSAIYAAMKDQSVITQADMEKAKAFVDQERRNQGFALMTGVEKPNVSFDDIGGHDEIIPKIRKLANFTAINDNSLGAKAPRGVLFVGPPGTGKTELARALATESDCNFIAVNGSEFVQRFVGEGADRVRELFETARENKPCIIFIDEADTLFRKRSADGNSGNTEYEQTLNQILTEMDGMKGTNGVLVIAATNRPDMFDPAALRRFNRQISVPLPSSAKARNQILEIHTRSKPLARDVNLKEIAKDTIGYSGADLANLVNEAATLAADAKQEVITTDNFNDALDIVELGEKSLDEPNYDDLKLVGIHEVIGHGLIAMACRENLRAVTMEARRPKEGGQVLGFVRIQPKEGIATTSIDYYLKRVLTAVGGRMAEKTLLGRRQVTTGGGSDYHQAESIIVQMIQSGMIEGYGPKNPNEHRALTQEERQLVKFIIGQAEQAAEQIIKSVPQAKLLQLVDASIKAQTKRNKEAEAIYHNILNQSQDWEQLHQLADGFVDNILDAIETKAQEEKNNFTHKPVKPNNHKPMIKRRHFRGPLDPEKSKK